MSLVGDLIGVGSPLVDSLCFVDDAFVAAVGGRKGGTELVDRETMQSLLARLPRAPERAPGGSAANTVVGAARLGASCGLLCKIGDDDRAGFYRERMSSAGVALDAFKTNADEATGMCLSLVTPDSQRTMRTYLGAAATMATEDVTPADFAGFAYAHIEGYLLFDESLMRHVLTAAKQAGCRISLDLAAPEVVQATRGVLPGLLAEFVDMVFANEDEAAVFADTTDEQAGLDALAECCPLAVVKLGKRGALIRHGAETATVQARVVDAVDTTGAGDLWAAGFLYGLINGADIATAGRIGAITGAEVVLRMGAWITADDWADIRAKVAAELP